MTATTGSGTSTRRADRPGRESPGPGRESPVTAAGHKAVGFIDRRLGSARFLRSVMNKVFPDHWSFMIGEIALYSFGVLVATGVYLTFFFEPSEQQTVYDGSYVPLRGVTMSRAYASTLDISFDVRAGLVIRQIHHWAALLFVAAIIVHLCRIFFTGAFRRPREINWLIGVSLLLLAIAEGFAGYSLPDDLLSGTGVRIAYAIAESIPVVGTWIAWGFWGGEFPGTHFITRLYVVHILLVPGLLLALIGAHLGILWHQKHTQFPGPGRTEDNVVGSRLFPGYAAKSVGFLLITAGLLAVLGGVAQINPVWAYGPYTPMDVSSLAQPDWYVGFLEGSLRLFLPWEYRGLGHDVPPVLWPGVVLPGVLFGLLAAYPFLEALVTRDHDQHNLLQRPRHHPDRTAFGVMALTFYGVLLLAGGDDVFALVLHLSLNAVVWAGRIGLLVLPPFAFYATRRLCRAAAARERRQAAAPEETGWIRLEPAGRYTEVELPKPSAPAPALAAAERVPPAIEGPTSGRQRGQGRLRRAVVGFFTRPRA
ncbi:menaquinol-cytochrome c reductase cytochrome b subunit precursor [Frankia sp. CcI6]|uniref:cytochrome bc1 complex cytochrome b subunit n=1 Tax=unclassified Frankia TaxID=2632575 RepID=UPI0003D03C0B|nr:MULTISPECIES: ubiquinol-cytochrome c reductase cytochrome b subunit [unclassified Frankia]ETA00736.1 menaquinol-cytochrome c reductase cytochrome b subunit precursor [Frankia sp. CcI6]OAA21038.1 menaquinol-cytochrome c reductase cytochrome b subunit precursor [Frankia casuarinae]OHV51624.1 menaquinol-cytochrome C reductase [Frankia sp. CgIS1]